jgi:hypothetical protein
MALFFLLDGGMSQQVEAYTWPGMELGMQVQTAHVHPPLTRIMHCSCTGDLYCLPGVHFMSCNISDDLLFS